MTKEVLGLEITELRLGLPGDNIIATTMEKSGKKRVFSEITSFAGGDKIERENQVVGWPPVCSYRRNNINGFHGAGTTKVYVKVSMDGAPFLRKIDLSTYKGYHDLALALEKLFGCHGMVWPYMWTEEALRKDNSSGYVPIYEDKDGDWMLVGDVPWEMFTESCKRLRIMKKSKGKGASKDGWP